MSSAKITRSTITWTKIDEAPALATYSLLPIVQAFTKGTGVEVETSGHLPGRAHHRQLPRAAHATTRRSPTSWRAWASWPRRPEANIIKLPNISASIPQLQAAIKELQEPGLRHPRLPRGAADRRREGPAGPLRRGARLGGQPGAARGQLRPPRRGLGEEVRPEASAQDDEGLARVRLEDPRGPHDRARTSTAARSPTTVDAATDVRIEFVGRRRRRRRC